MNGTLASSCLTLLALTAALQPAAALPSQAPARPGAMIENRGQWPAPVRFRRVGGGATTWFLDRAFVLALERPEVPGPREVPGALPPLATSDVVHGVGVHLVLEGAQPRSVLGEEALPGWYHFLLGNDAARWTRHVPGFARVRYAAAWPGIDVVVRQHEAMFAYDLQVAPGADVSAATLRCLGADTITWRDDGALVLHTALGDVVHSAPIAWSTRAGGRRPHPARCVQRGEGRFGFEVDGWNGNDPLTIDPGLAWSSYVGGNQNEHAYGVTRHATRVITVAGSTQSANLPITPGAYQTTRQGTEDAFVAQYAEDGGTLRFCSYVGGGGSEYFWELALDSQLRPVCGGATGSSNFPVTGNAPQAVYGGGGGDACVCVLSADGSNVDFGTYHGGNASQGEGVQGFHLDVTTDVVAIGGWTRSTNLPVTANAFQSTYGGGGGTSPYGDGFVALFDIQWGARLYASYLGGSEFEYVSGLHNFGATSVTLVLGTFSSNLPVTATALQPSFNGPLTSPISSSGDVYIAQLRPDAAGTQLAYASYFGGPDIEWPFGVDVDASTGILTLAGGGLSIPTTPGALRPTNTQADAFLSRLDPSLPVAQQLVYSTFLGGSLWDNGWRLFVEPGTNIANVCGATASLDLSVTPGAFQPGFGGGSSFFMGFPLDGQVHRVLMDVSVQPPAGQLLYCSYVGAPQSASNEGVWDVQGGPDRMLTLCGFAQSALPTAYGPQTGFAGGSCDGFVMRIVTPGGFGTFGQGCGTTGARLQADLQNLPLLGGTFTARVVSLPPNRPGFAMLDTTRLLPAAPLDALGLTGCRLHVQPTVLQWFVANVLGHAAVTVPVPNIPAFYGLEVYLQAAVDDPGANPAGIATTHGAVAMIGR